MTLLPSGELFEGELEGRKRLDVTDRLELVEQELLRLRRQAERTSELHGSVVELLKLLSRAVVRR